MYKPPWPIGDPDFFSDGRSMSEQNAGGCVCCIDCEATMTHAHEAVQAGWTEVEADISASWDFLGYCPECAEKNREAEPLRQRTLF